MMIAKATKMPPSQLHVKVCRLNTPRMLTPLRAVAAIVAAPVEAQSWRDAEQTHSGSDQERVGRSRRERLVDEDEQAPEDEREVAENPHPGAGCLLAHEHLDLVHTLPYPFRRIGL